MFESLNKMVKLGSELTLYHGTNNDRFVPDYNFNNPNNDYGKGLYLTEDIDRAKEWALSIYNKNNNGFVYEFNIDISSLNILDLNDYDSLYWLVILLENRNINIDRQIPLQTKNKLIQKYHLDISSYDVIKGWRADDSYFRFAKDFVYGLIDKETLDRAMKLGLLGQQYCIKSKKAFDCLSQIKIHEVEPEYRDKFYSSDRSAREEYNKLSNTIPTDNIVYKFI